MNGRAYYNENDPAAAAILRVLIERNVIMPGDVDTRSIKDVRPGDLAEYTQCHFFAGGGLWSVAARLAGWPDERELWTGSCPCQPFSAAGKGLGTDDPRHLWPDFHRLIRAKRPSVVMGEQVAGAAGYGWFDGVCADLEVEDYAARAVDIPACTVDAPHQRNRLYWIAMDNRLGAGLEGQRGHVIGTQEGRSFASRSPAASDAFIQSDAGCELRRPGSAIAQNWKVHPNHYGFLQSDSNRGGRPGRPEDAQRQAEQRAIVERPLLRNGSWWSDAKWIVSPLDGKARRAKPGISFLVDGLPGRVDLWRVGGNAIVPILAAEVIAAFLETESIGDLT